MTTANHLVVVCGHGIWLGGPRNGYDESEWLIESYKAGETPTFIEHIRAGVKELAADDRAALVFSGAATRQESPLSEGRSYANLAAANNYFGLLGADPVAPDAMLGRVLVEDQALDSYYNILFSLVTFWRAHGVWPTRLTIVSHAFKKTRIVHGHCGPDAIDFPVARVRFIGINPPNLPAEFGTTDKTSETTDQTTTGIDKAAAMKGAHDVLGHWAADPHGIGPLLAGKRRARNPWAVRQLMFSNDAERRRSGLHTRILEGMEALADDSPRPWKE